MILRTYISLTISDPLKSRAYSFSRPANNVYRFNELRIFVLLVMQRPQGNHAKFIGATIQDAERVATLVLTVGAS